MTITEQVQAKINATQREIEYLGLPLKLRLAPLILWAEQGRVPQYLSSLFLAQEKAQEQADDADYNPAFEDQPAFSEAETAEWLSFREQVVTYACLEPAITFTGEADKISADELEAVAPGVMTFIFQYATRALLVSDKGDVSANPLTTFRADETRAAGTVGIGDDSREIRAAPVSAAGHRKRNRRA